MRKAEIWTLAYRKRNGNGTLPGERTSNFTTIPNSFRFWRGDPFLFEENGRTYIFAETYDRILHTGRIGCAELTDNGVGKWRTVIKMPYHLSYPFVFRRGADIFMIPESYCANEIALYRAVDFPYKWEKARVLAENIKAVDTTLIPLENGGYTLLCQRLYEDGTVRLLSSFLDGDMRAGEFHDASKLQDNEKRPAGKCFYENGRLLRPAQDCTESYGHALNFYEVCSPQDGGADDFRFSETLVAKVGVDDIKVDGPAFSGVHTYNMSDKYEIIDLRSYETDVIFFFTRPFLAAGRRVKSLFRKTGERGQKNGD